MIRSTRARVVAVLAATSLLAAACGGDDDDVTDAVEDAADDAADAAEDAADDAADAAEDVADDAADAAEDIADEAEDVAEDVADEAEDAVDEVTDEPIKIGLLTSLTTNFAPWGLQARDGMLLAAQEINDAGGVDGRMIEIVEADDENDAESAVAGYERLAEEGVVGIGGLISSTTGLAVSPLAEELQIPTFTTKAGATEILTADSRHMFRTCLPGAPMVSEPIAQYTVANGLTKVGAIIADYGWGQAIKAALEEDFAELDGVELQVEVAPVGESDFTTYLRNLEGFGPELIVATGHPPGSGPITVQSVDLGFDVPITGAWSPYALVWNGAGEAGIERYSDFDCADYESDSYQDLARRFLAFSDQTFMEDDAVSGYGIVTMLADAVGAVGDDPAAIAEYLHGQSYDLEGYPFTVSWTEWGELAEAQPLFTIMGEGPAPEGVNEAGEWYPRVLLRPDPLEPFDPAG